MSTRMLAHSLMKSRIGASASFSACPYPMSVTKHKRTQHFDQDMRETKSVLLLTIYDRLQQLAERSYRYLPPLPHFVEFQQTRTLTRLLQ